MIQFQSTYNTIFESFKRHLINNSNNIDYDNIYLQKKALSSIKL